MFGKLSNIEGVFSRFGDLVLAFLDLCALLRVWSTFGKR